jgi:hypothetical protein
VQRRRVHLNAAKDKRGKKKTKIETLWRGTSASCELFFRMTSRNTDHYTTKDLLVIDGRMMSRVANDSMDTIASHVCSVPATALVK